MTTVHLLTRSDTDEFEVLGVFATEQLAQDELTRLVESGEQRAWTLDVEPWPVQETAPVPEAKTPPVQETAPAYPATRAALLKAAALLEQNGWCQGSSVDSHGRYCLVGAVSAVTNVGGEGGYFGTMEALSDHLGVTGLALWNDEPDRTFDEVVAALRDAAASIPPAKGPQA